MITVSNITANMMLAYNGTKATNSMNTALERLITGFKINRPSDDVAGWYTFNKMSMDVQNYTSAQANAQSGVNYLKTATGAMDEMSKLLKELDGLAKEATDTTISDKKRAELQKSVDEKTAQITKLQKDTKFNGINVFGDDGVLITPVTKLTEAEALAQGYTVIKTADEFVSKINANKGGKFILMNDIDFNGKAYTAITDFSGTLKGNGQTIKNVKITEPLSDNQGLFANMTTGSSVSDVVLENFDISGKTIVGALAGKADNVTINNIAVLEGTISGGSYTGGLAGRVENNSTISNSYATGHVNGGTNSGHVGGFAGYLENSAISNSYATGNVSGGSSIGGLAGVLSNGIISNSYATGNVSGGADSAALGGLAGGLINGTISNSYATGNVSGGTDSGGGNGGLAGYLENSAISNSYATGNVSGGYAVGGLIGEMAYSTTISNSFWDIEKSGQTIGVGSGSSTGTTGLTTAQMKEPSYFRNAGWDSSIWDIYEGTGPQLKNMPKFSNPKQEMNVFVGTTNDPSSHIKINAGLSVKDLAVDLSSVESARLSLDSINTVTKRIDTKKKDVEISSSRLTGIIDGLKANIATLNDGMKKVYGANEDIENENYLNAQILQEACQSLLMQSAQINSSIIMTLLPKPIGYK